MELAFEDSHLLAEHDHLDVLVRLGLTARDNEAEEPAEAEAEKGEDHCE